MPDSNDTRTASHPTASHDPGREGTREQTPAEAADSAAASGGPTPPVVPGYEVLEEIGHGGMGVVYRARQLGLNREVAVKTILRADLPRATVARFWAEAEVMAAVRHPNVVQVIELGEHAGRPFMAMEYLPGGSLAGRLLSGPLPPRDAAAVLEQIARGVAAAHESGIVHRDLKPGNILLGAGGEPKVADFGLAKRRVVDLTATQAIMGTPAYMAPEQAAGRAKFVGPPADVWALGVILYECVAGERPFAADTAESLLSRIQSSDAPPLRARVRDVPRDLETIVAKCLAKEPEHRYPTAAELADDLGRFIRGEPIAARPLGRVERLARWVRRKPTAAAAYGFSALAVLLALVTFVVFGFWRAAEAARDSAEGARGDAESARDTADRLRGVADAGRIEETRLRGVADRALLGEAAARREVEREREKLARIEYGRVIQVGYEAWKTNRVDEARRLLAETRPDLRGWEWRYVHRLCHGDLLTFRGDPRSAETASIMSAAFSPDGSKVLTVTQTTADIRDATTGATLVSMPALPAKIVTACWNPSGTSVAFACTDGNVYLQGAADGWERSALKGRATSGYHASFSPDGKHILTRYSDESSRVWDADTGEPIRALTGRVAGANCWSHDGKTVLSVDSTGTARGWDVASGKSVFVRTSGGGAAAFSRDGQRVLTVGTDGTAKVWDWKTGDLLVEAKVNHGSVSHVALSPNGSKFLTTQPLVGPGGESNAGVWDATTGKQITRLFNITNLFAIRTLDMAAAFQRPPGVSLQNRPDGMTEITFPKDLLDNLCLAVWNSDGSRFATAGQDGIARVHDSSNGNVLLEAKGQAGAVACVSFSPDGTKLLTVGFDGTARVWDARWSPEWAFPAEAGIVFRASFQKADNQRRVLHIDQGKVTVRGAATGEELVARLGPTFSVVSATFSTDGTRIVTDDYDHTVQIWDAESGALLLTIPGWRPGLFQATPRTVQVAFDGSRIVLANKDTGQMLVVYDARALNREFFPRELAPAPRAKP